MATGTRSRKRKRFASLVQEQDDEQPAKLQKSDFICPVCFDFLKEVYVTDCGHSFCYQCITRHLAVTPQCPVCKLSLQRGGIHPNFALNDVIAKVKLQEDKEKVLEKSSPLFGELMNATTEMNDTELDKVLACVQNLKRSRAQREKQYDNKVLLDFLLKSKEEIEEEVQVKLKHIGVLEADIRCVTMEAEKKPSLSDLCLPESEAVGAVVPSVSPSESIPSLSSVSDSEEIPSSSTTSAPPSTLIGDGLMASVIAAKNSRIHSHFAELRDDYISTKLPSFEDPSIAEDTLSLFADGLKRFTKFTTFRELSSLSYGDQTSSNCSIVSSIEFDKDADFFAVAGVTKVIKVFDYHSVLRGVGFTNHYPVQEMACSAKLSSVYFNDYHKSTLVSSDYEGYVAVWDTAYGKKVVSHHEHSKRVWSVVYNPSDPNLFASGSDDCTVKLWSSSIPHSIFTLHSKANVCSVRFNSENRYHLAYGSADHAVHYIDLRNPKEPLHQLGGHRKAVSYVQFCSPTELVSASTDSELKLWNVNNGQCLRTYKGHINDKNFVGLTVTPHFIACGSENNSLYVYAKQVSRPMLTYKFNVSRNILQSDVSSSDSQPGQQGELTDFVSSVCWKPNSNIVLCANSQGHIKVLEMC